MTCQIVCYTVQIVYYSKIYKSSYICLYKIHLVTKIKKRHDLRNKLMSIYRFSGNHYNKYHDCMLIYTRREDICRLLEIQNKIHLISKVYICMFLSFYMQWYIMQEYISYSTTLTTPTLYFNIYQSASKYRLLLPPETNHNADKWKRKEALTLKKSIQVEKEMYRYQYFDLI